MSMAVPLPPRAYTPPLTEADLAAMEVSGDDAVTRLVREVRAHRKMIERAAGHLESAADIILEDVMHGRDIDGDDADVRRLIATLRAVAAGDAAWRPEE